MKKIIQFLTILILLVILVFLIIFFFNPFDSRNKLIGSAINYYFQIEMPRQGDGSSTILDADSKENNATSTNTNNEASTVLDKNPLLSEEQEKKLESYGVDVGALPKEITPGMTSCFIEKLGQERAMQIVAGDTPGALEILKVKECLSK